MRYMVQKGTQGERVAIFKALQLLFSAARLAWEVLPQAKQLNLGFSLVKIPDSSTGSYRPGLAVFVKGNGRRSQDTPAAQEWSQAMIQAGSTPDASGCAGTDPVVYIEIGMNDEDGHTSLHFLVHWPEYHGAVPFPGVHDRPWSTDTDEDEIGTVDAHDTEMSAITAAVTCFSLLDIKSRMRAAAAERGHAAVLPQSPAAVAAATRFADRPRPKCLDS